MKEEISTYARARIKRYCSYTGPSIPQSVQEKFQLSNLLGIWLWHDDEPPGRWEIVLSDLDDDESIEPADTAVIQPRDGQYILFFVNLEWAGHFVFDDLLSAKRHLDQLLFTATPRIPSTWDVP